MPELGARSEAGILESQGRADLRSWEKKLCLSTSLQMKYSPKKGNNPCHLLLVKKYQEVVCCNT